MGFWQDTPQCSFCHSLEEHKPCCIFLWCLREKVRTITALYIPAMRRTLASPVSPCETKHQINPRLARAYLDHRGHHDVVPSPSSSHISPRELGNSCVYPYALAHFPGTSTYLFGASPERFLFFVSCYQDGKSRLYHMNDRLFLVVALRRFTN